MLWGVLLNRWIPYPFKRLLVGSILNLLIVYGLGMIYLYFIMNLYLGKPIGVEAVIITCFLIPVGPDIFLCAVAASLGKTNR